MAGCSGVPPCNGCYLQGPHESAEMRAGCKASCCSKPGPKLKRNHEISSNPFRAKRISMDFQFCSVRINERIKTSFGFYQLSSALRRGSNLAQSQMHFKAQSSLIKHDSTVYFLEVSIWRHTSKLGTVEIK